MAIGAICGDGQAMATRWRRRRMCVLLAPRPASARLREVTARGAFLETNARPALGHPVELRHPDAGAIAGIVTGVSPDGIDIGFRYETRSVAFALAAITADMSRPDHV